MNGTMSTRIPKCHCASHSNYFVWKLKQSLSKMSCMEFMHLSRGAPLGGGERYLAISINNPSSENIRTKNYEIELMCVVFITFLKRELKAFMLFNVLHLWKFFCSVVFFFHYRKI